MSTEVISRRYARALMNLAVREQQVSEVAAALDDVADAVQSSAALERFLADPEVPLGAKEQVAADLVERAASPPLVANFVRLVTRKRRAVLLDEMRRVFHRLADERLGRGQADVTVAAGLTDAQQDALRERLERLSGKTLSLHVTVDPAILGGVVARIGSTVWDGSLRHELERIHEAVARG